MELLSSNPAHVSLDSAIDLSNLQGHYSKITENLKTDTKEANEVIKGINRDFVSKLVKIDPLFINAIDRTVHLTGRKSSKFTDKEISDISKEHTKLKRKCDLKIEKWKTVKNKLKNASEEKVLYGWMAKAAYQYEVKEGKIIETGAGHYKADKVITNEEGLRAVCFVPVKANSAKEGGFEIEAGRSPVLAFRGTNPSNPRHLSDDLQSIIGNRSFLLSKDEILEALNDLNAKTNTGCVVAGHSLGGALTQRTTAEYAGQGLISEAYYYNSPGVGQEIVNKYLANTEGKVKPKLVDIHHHTDIIHRFGGSRLPTDQLVLDTTGKISKLAAHKLNNLVEGLENLHENKLNDYKERFNSLRTRVKHFILEAGRTITSPFLRAITKTVFAMKGLMPCIRRFFGDYRGQQVDFIKKKIGYEDTAL